MQGRRGLGAHRSTHGWSAARIGPVAVGSIQGRPHRVVRTSAQISCRRPECILLYLLIRGAVRIEQEDRSCRAASWRPGVVTTPPDPPSSRARRPSKCSSSACRAGSSGRAPRTSRAAAQRRAAGAGAPLARLAAPFLAELGPQRRQTATGCPGNRRRGRCGDDPAAAAQRVRRRRTLRGVSTPSSPLARPPAAIRDRAPARPRSRPGAARERPLRVDALRAQALRGIGLGCIGVDSRSPPRGSDRRASRHAGDCDRRRCRAMGLPQPGELQSGLSRQVRLRAERRPPRVRLSA